MDDIIKNNKINGPINFLFSRSPENKKNKKVNYNMSANVPSIKIVTDTTSARPTVKLDKSLKITDIDIVKNRDSDVDSVSSGSTIEAQQSENKNNKVSSLKSKSKFNPDDYQNFVNNSKTKDKKIQDSDDSDSGSEGSQESGSDEYSDTSSQSSEESSSKKKGSKQEKQQILMKLVSLEKKGIELTKKYSMSSKLEELKFELNLHESSAEVEMSIKMQQKMLMAAVTGLEFANKRFDPLGAKLDGWSESVMDNIDDYETVFAKLHEKYKSRADLPPELQLLVTLVGGAFMFHVTKTMFSSAMPKGLNDTQSSEIMKNISSAMANPPPPQVSNVSSKEISGPSLNLSNFFQKTDDVSSVGTVETSREVTINQKGKRAINL
tara:strand:+ start:8369 stop:9505 length:1137 start_codon:yes stop_codon:yes gene_type:complete